MRHKIKTNRLDRFSSYRKATINSIARAVLLNYSIKTSYSKAKASQGEIERLITLAKSGALNDRRQAYRVLGDHKLVQRLFKEFAELFRPRTGGYTRIIKTGFRRGDGAQMVILEFSEKPKKEKTVKKEKAHIEPIPEQEAGKPQEKTHISKEEKPKVVEKKMPTKKFLDGLRRFFKKERDSL